MITKLKQQIDSRSIQNVEYATLTVMFEQESLNYSIALLPQQLRVHHFVAFSSLENCTNIELLIKFKDRTEQLITHPSVSDWLL